MVKWLMESLIPQKESNNYQTCERKELTELRGNCATAGGWGRGDFLPKQSDSDLSEPITKG
jgi:hypothetical protein